MQGNFPPTCAWPISATARGVIIATAALVAAQLAPHGAKAQSVNLYTTREPGLVKPLLEAFTAKTRIAVNTVHVKAGLEERVAAEGARSPADLLMTVDFGNLVELVEKGVTQPVKSAALEAAVPKHLRDPNGHWYALSLRARLVYAAKKLGGLEGFTYGDLAEAIGLFTLDREGGGLRIADTRTLPKTPVKKTATKAVKTAPAKKATAKKVAGSR